MNPVRVLSIIILAAAALHAGVAARVAAQTTPLPPVTDPLALELQRCKELGEKANSNQRCRAAYKQSRDQFLAPSKPYEPQNVDMFPTTGKEPKRFEPKKPNVDPIETKQ